MQVVRAWRPGALTGLPSWPDGEVGVEGRVVEAEGVALELDRGAWPDGTGRAERAEAEGDLLAAAGRWRCLSDVSPGAQGAYALLRAASALAAVESRANAVGETLVEAMGRCPRLPEAALMLAGWCIGRDRIEDGLAWAAIADAIRVPAPGVPHPVGTGTWLVSERMAVWLAGVGHPAAQVYAAQALAAEPPSPAQARLASILGSPGSGRTQTEPLPGGQDHHPPPTGAP